jgi:flagellar motor switch protein FliG
MMLPPKRKAALLLMILDSATASSLLQAAGPELATELAAELASLESAPQQQEAARDQMIREFLERLLAGRPRTRGMAEFRKLLESAMGADQSQQILAKAQRMAAARDPFAGLRDVPPEQLMEALKGESPQVVALAMADLPPSRGTELLNLLPEAVRPEVVKSMAVGEAASSEVRLRVATTLQQRVKSKPEAARGPVRNERLRRLAMVLRAQPPDQRKPLLEALTQQDAESAKQINELMVVWEDLLHLADRSFQEGLRVVDTRKLALALVGCDERLIEKIRRNISERARASLDEEASLLSSPTPQEVAEAQQAMLEALREINAQTGLRFEGS